MKLNTLGRTGLQVTELGYGTGQLRGAGLWGGHPIEPQQADKMLNMVLDAGINLIDTANVYGNAEDYIGRFIAARRAAYVLATKCGCTLVPVDGIQHEVRRDWTPAQLEQSIDRSLRRMRTDYVDLLQYHNPTVDDFEKHDLGRVMEDARAAGKTRFLGISTSLPHLPYFLKLGLFDVFQIPYSALEREHEAWISEVVQHNVGTIIRGGVAKGGPVKGGEQQGKWERAKLDDLLDGSPRITFMLRYTLTHPGLHCNIVATINPENFQQNLAAVEMGPLPDDVYTEAKRRLSELGEIPDAVALL
jgi:aryl-alcohol dehydrogenase-like predicted oxidoreductase